MSWSPQKRRAAAQRGWENRKRQQVAGRVAELRSQAEADGYGPGGHRCGSESHKVKSIKDILTRLRARPSST